ncbi:uncharacterized protein LOC111389152 [Olea europaea var. sylvestris]|uniref:uncharacterized protein LOC111389152 n=1 Tax=Olea europaea var. sylvestris TaxID=158386 RepID=UPI000C1D1822|nr:uncharacterized protein LOC111389152 [Olea europaea var. sylvestris]
MVFDELIGKTMEVYIDDMLVKSLQANKQASYLDQTFQILRKYKMKLNILKSTFGMASGQFLGYIVNQREIEANPVKIRALLEMRATDKCLPFFKVLKQGKKFQWIGECEEAFQTLKKHLGEAHMLSKPKLQESLLSYLAISDEAVGADLVKEENEHQLRVYYVSKALLPAETRYPDMVKLALALITASRKLRSYFQAHSIEVLTNFPLKQGQALLDFVAEFAKAPKMEATMEPVEPPTWNLFVDGSSGETGFGAGIVLESPGGHKLNCAVKFDFKASNKAADYEALLAGLRLAKEMQFRRFHCKHDSQLVMSQVNGNFAAKDSSMATYLKLVLDLVPHFEKFELIQVPHLKNTHADALSKLASSKDSELLKIVPIEHLSKPSVSGGEELLWIKSTPLWIQPIMACLRDQSLPASRSETMKLRIRVAHFVLQEDVLYKRGFALPLLRCVGGEEATSILREIHEEICENQSGGMALAHKVLRRGYFWPTLKMDACRFGIPHSLVSNNGRQFNNKKMRDLCDELGIKKDFSTPHHPQANGQVEAVNETIKDTLKMKLDTSKGAWVDELPHVLWAIRTTSRIATG